MRYVDIGTLPNQHSTNFRRNNSSAPAKKAKGRRFIKTTSWLVFLGILLFGIYSILPPIKDSLASMLGGSSAVFSYLVNGKQELKKDGGKTNILLMGIDKRAEEQYTYQDANGIISRAPFRTDTIIVASYNYDSEKVTMLSIPRDLWVDVPSFGDVQSQSMKINGVYALGDTYNYPGGGAALLSKILQNMLQVPIHYTARIDFAGFEKAIDSVGGIDIVVENAFVDDEYPIEGKEDAWPVSSRYRTLQFKAGLQHMDGETALAFARSRHGSNGEGTDFARAKRQQLVISAFKDKVFNPVTVKSPQVLIDLYKSLGDSFATTITVNEMLGGYDLAKNIDSSHITAYNLDDRPDNPGGLLYSPPMANYGGAWVLIPDEEDYSEVRQFVQQIFSSSGLPSEPSPTPASAESEL